MFLVLRDINPEIVMAWTQTFGNYKGVSIGTGNILRADVDAIVSPANSFCYMNGCIDLAYRNFFGLRIHNRLQRVIRNKFSGELPVGKAVIIPTSHHRIKRMIAAPTMRTPVRIEGTQNVYLAMKAALECAFKAKPPIQRLGIPGLGTGIGGMDPNDAAEQMCNCLFRRKCPSVPEQSVHLFRG